MAYIIDDPYIHMAIAKNLALHGVYGVTRFEWTGASSSPLWTCLLGGLYFLFGVRTWLPLVLNILSACGTLILIDRLACRFALGNASRCITVLAVALCAPLPTLVAMGMEHSLHVCLCLALLLAAERMLAEKASSPSRVVVACTLSALATGVRYETLFLAGGLALALFWQRKWRDGGLLALAASAPVLAYGLYAMLHGGFFLPNSFIVKADAPVSLSWHALAGIAGSLWRRGYFYFCVQHSMAALLVALPLAWFGLPASRARCRGLGWLVFLLVLALLAHGSLVAQEAIFRYSAYLFVAGMSVLAILACIWCELQFAKPLSTWDSAEVILVLGAALLTIGPIVERAAIGAQVIPSGAASTYRQQVQMARMANDELPPASRLAVNDLGAVSYYTDAHILDLVGLGTAEVALLARARTLDAGQQARLLEMHGTQFVIVYPEWFKTWDGYRPPLPTNLIAVATWRLLDSGTCGGDTVAFYGTTPTHAKTLAAALERYQPRLPPGTAIHWLYTRR